MMLVPRLFWLFPAPKQNTGSCSLKDWEVPQRHCYICEGFIVGLSPSVDLTFIEPLLIQSPIQLY